MYFLFIHVCYLSCSSHPPNLIYALEPNFHAPLYELNEDFAG